MYSNIPWLKKFFFYTFECNPVIKRWIQKNTEEYQTETTQAIKKLRAKQYSF